MGTVRYEVLGPRPSVAKLVVLKLLGAAVPAVTIGMFGWLLTGLVALKRRSIALGLSAAGYLGMTVWFIAYAVIPDNPEITDGQTVVTLLYLLATIPGVSRQDGDSIVFSRTHHGRFRRIDDLWTRGLLPVQLAPQLTTRLVVIGVQDSVGGAGQTS
ncbi:hypothetical protein [Kribbella catacumbae]|uniref:hypothetical protein n=1 Tax=Kribbella catacumbae TaxID=460086 RepID=UPI00035D7AED|nr:hypothetical protein [Kribbella catacumbae]